MFGIPGLGMVLVSIGIGLIGWYLFHLEKKGRKMQETEAGRREYYEKYTPDRIKRKNTIKTATIGKPNTRIRMSKKDRRKNKSEEKIS